ADVSVGSGIRIGGPPPPPPPPVVVRETVVVQDAYIVGPRRIVYDADIRLRIAQAEEFRATEYLDKARAHEERVAGADDESEKAIEAMKAELAELEAGGAKRAAAQ